MAIEALLAERNEKFDHLPCHDLESILYVILITCTFTKGPCFPRPDFETPNMLNMKTWFSTEPMKNIGFRKIAHMCKPDDEIIPGFTECWEDFGPFALDLIQLCFPSIPAKPNELTHQGMLSILERACMTVKETPTNEKNLMWNEPTNVKKLKRNELSDPPVRKRG